MCLGSGFLHCSLLMFFLVRSGNQRWDALLGARFESECRQIGIDFLVHSLNGCIAAPDQWC